MPIRLILNTILVCGITLATHTLAFAQTSSLLWSNPRSWPSGRVPVAGENVTIPAGSVVELDVDSAALGGLTILGTLKFKHRPLNLSARWIMLHGELRVGSQNQKFMHKATITLTGSNPNESVMGMGTRGIMVMGGKLELHGAPPLPVWTRLGANAPAGSSSLTLETYTDWKAGDELALAPTDYFDKGRTEVFTLQTNHGNRTFTLDRPSLHARWGVRQYLDADQGLTLTPTSSISERSIDERAEVANLTRPIVIQSIDDALWRNEGFGAQIMFMDGGVSHIEGVQIRRAGQAGRIGRYPLHWHLMSYDAQGNAMDDLSGQYVSNSVVTDSSQRCMVIHGTNGLRLDRNICHKIRGHAFFLEDAVERRNIIVGNLALDIRVPLQGRALQAHETNHDERTGPSGFWLTNPDNTVRDNVAADAEGMGFWLAYPRGPLGLNRNVRIEPQHTPFGIFSNNVTHSNKVLGFQIDHVPINDAGDTQDLHYIPLQGGFQVDGAVEAPFTISRLTTYKNPSALWNRVRMGTFSEFIVADFNGTGFKGGSQQCKITKSIVLGHTLNHSDPSDVPVPRVGAASYHSECDITDNIFVNLPAVPGQASGAFDSSDYYTSGLDMGLRRNVGNLFLKTHPGYRSPSLNTKAIGAGHENWSLAGALWDPQGLWGTAGHYWVYDQPFFTGGTSCSAVTDPVHGNDKSCVGPYYGVGPLVLDRSADLFKKPIRYQREDNGSEFFVDDGNCTWRLGHMRNTSMVKNGRYIVSFPAGERSDDRGTCQPSQLAADTPPPQSLAIPVTNLRSVEDGFLLAVEFDGRVAPIAYRTSWPNPFDPLDYQWESLTAWQAENPAWKSLFRGEFIQPMKPALSLAEVQSSQGDKYWQDSSRNLLWILVRRTGLEPLQAEPNSDLDLQRTVHFVIERVGYRRTSTHP